MSHLPLPDRARYHVLANHSLAEGTSQHRGSTTQCRSQESPCFDFHGVDGGIPRPRGIDRLFFFIRFTRFSAFSTALPTRRENVWN